MKKTSVKKGIKNKSHDKYSKIKRIIDRYHLKPTTQRNLPLLTQSIMALGYTNCLKKRLGYSYETMAYLGKGDYFHAMMNEEALNEKTERMLRRKGEKGLNQIFRVLLLDLDKIRDNIHSVNYTCSRKDLKVILDNYLDYMRIISTYNCFWRYLRNKEHDEFLSDKIIAKISKERYMVAKIYPEIEKKIYSVSEKLGKQEGFDGLLLRCMSYSEINDYIKKGLSKSMIKELKKRKKQHFYIFEGSTNKEIVITDIRSIDKIKKEFYSVEANISQIKGYAANKGNAKGIVFNSLESHSPPKAYILVAPTTHPKDIKIIKNAKALVIDEGGILSHAAIISRELNKPCIIATKIGTKVFKDGDLIEVDANKGIVRKLK